MKGKCPGCGLPYELDGALAGRKARCEECKTEFLVGHVPVPPRSRAPALLIASCLLIAAGLALWNLSRARAAGAAASAAAEPAPADGILHQWNFDEARDWHESPFGSLTVTPVRVVDVAGGWDATPRGFAAADWVSGREFMALHFPGGAAALAVEKDLGPALGGTASLAFWIRTTQAGGATAKESPGVAGALGGVEWAWLDAAGHLNLTAKGRTLARTDKPVNDDLWHFVVMTRDAASGQGQAFLDGARVDGQAGPAGERRQPCHRIGGVDGATVGFQGRLDKVTLLNRVMGPDEVKAFMANHAPKTWTVATEGLAGKTFVTGSPLARGYDVEGDALSVRRAPAPAHGRAEALDDGSFRYTPAAGFTGRDRFEVVVQDGRGGFHLSAIEVSVVPDLPGGGKPLSQFARLRTLQAGGRDLEYAGLAVPVLVDWDGDGLTDLLVGAGGGVWFHRNGGTKTEPQFAAGVRVAVAGAPVASGDNMCPIAIADWNGDGVADLLYSDRERRLQLCRRQADGALAAAQAVATLPDRRFDAGDWNGDGVPDVVTGTGSGEVRLFRGRRSAGEVTLDGGETLFAGSYNMYPRFCDLDHNGRVDLARGVNWGGLHYWIDVGAQGLAKDGDFVMTRADGKPEDLRATDGAIAALGDLDGDGLADLVAGGHTGNRLVIAQGCRLTVRDHLREIESIYDAHADRLGDALDADQHALLNRVAAANRAIAKLIDEGGPQVRQEVFEAVSAHVRKYPFLKIQPLELPRYRHVPGTALQNVIFLHLSRPDTRRNREEVAEIAGLAGVYRDVFVERGLVLGDNGKLSAAQLGTIRDFQRHHPRELFPDDAITFDQIFGDGRGAMVWTPNSSKNTFGCDVGNASEWEGDLVKAIEADLGKGGSHGDYFTFVMGHEVTHSLDGYVSSRANRDLRRRWGRQLCRAAGPDVIPGLNGWPDWEATKARFAAAGYFAPATQKWDAAWSHYWSKGPGAAFRGRSFMRGNIDWFLASPQESLATQANHHWANGIGRLIGALARWKEGERTGNLPMKANLTEVVDFIDYVSAGMNRVALPRPFTRTGADGAKQVEWTLNIAELERDDHGWITRITVAGHDYRLTLDDEGGVVRVES